MVEYIKHPAMLKEISIEEIREWIEEFPYSQNLRILLAQKIKLEEGADQHEAYIDAALYTTDRNKLYEDLHTKAGSDAEKEESENVHHQEPVETKKTDLKPEVVSPAGEVEIVESSSDIEGGMLTESLNGSNGESEVFPDIRAEADSQGPVDVEKEGSEDIDRLSDFSLWLLSLSPPNKGVKDANTDAPVAPIIDQEGNQVISSALADLLIAQGHYKKAIEMYQLLQLKFPEKSGYFAAQIEKLKAI